MLFTSLRILPIPTLQEMAVWIAIAIVLGTAFLAVWKLGCALKKFVELWLVPRREYERDTKERDHRVTTDSARDKKVDKLLERLAEIIEKKSKH